MPVRTRFDSDEPEQPPYRQQQSPPAAAPEPPSPSSPRAPPRPLSPAKRLSEASPSHKNGPPAGSDKKRKVVVFDQEAEDEAAARANGDSSAQQGQQGQGQQGKRPNKLTPEQRKKAKEEALRLLPARKLLPVWAGAFLSRSSSLAPWDPPHPLLRAHRQGRHSRRH